MNTLALRPLGSRSPLLALGLFFVFAAFSPGYILAQEEAGGEGSGRLTVTDISQPPAPLATESGTPDSASPASSAADPGPTVGGGPVSLSAPPSPGGAADKLFPWSFSPSARNAFKAIGAFVLVLGLLLVCLKIVGWLGRGRMGAKGARAFTLRGTMALDNRRYLAAVEVDGHLLIVGVSPEGLSGLASWVLEEEPMEFSSALEGSAGNLKGKLELESQPGASLKKTVERSVEKSHGVSPRSPFAGKDEAPGADLALGEEPFEGPEVNDDFLKLDIKPEK